MKYEMRVVGAKQAELQGFFPLVLLVRFSESIFGELFSVRITRQMRGFPVFFLFFFVSVYLFDYSLFRNTICYFGFFLRVLK